jgi:hypothetical protein
MPVRVVAALLVLLVTAGCRDDPGLDAAGSDAARSGPLLVPVDEDTVFVYGGDRGSDVLADAALHDLRTGDVEQLDNPPLPAGLTNIAGGVLVDDTIVLLGHPCLEPIPDDPMGTCSPGRYGAAALALEDRTWSVVDLPAELREVEHGRRTPVGATTDGRAVFVLGGSDFSPGGEALWAYDVHEEAWEELASPRGRIDRPCLAGDVLVSVDRGSPVRRPHVETLDLVDPQGRWRRSDPLPDPLRRPGDFLGDPEPLCLDDAVLVHGPHGHTSYLRSTDPGSGWTIVAGVDASAPEYVWTGDRVLAVGGSKGDPVAVLDGDRWRSVGTVDEPVDRLVWTGTRLVGWPNGGATVPAEIAVGR